VLNHCQINCCSWKLFYYRCSIYPEGYL